jgi:hypothetical protein
MPIHLDELDVASEVAGMRSAMIVPCNMCPAVSVAVKESRPFLRFFKNLLKSAPLEQYIKALQSRLKAQGVHTSVFRSGLPLHWFMCMWTAGRRKKLKSRAKSHDAVIVLGCESATETVRDAVQSNGCKVIQGMEVSGVTNARLRFELPGNLTFQGCKTIPLSPRREDSGTPH